MGILDESDDELVMEELRELGLDFAFELLNFQGFCVRWEVHFRIIESFREGSDFRIMLMRKAG